MGEKDRCLEFLERKLIPQRLKVQGMGMLNTWGQTSEEKIKMHAQYSIEFDILQEYENQYQKLLHELKIELRNNQ